MRKLRIALGAITAFVFNSYLAFADIVDPFPQEVPHEPVDPEPVPVEESPDMIVPTLVVVAAVVVIVLVIAYLKKKK